MKTFTQINKWWLDSIYHDGSKFFLSNPLPKSGDSVTFSIQIKENAPVTNIFLRIRENGEERVVKMEKSDTKNGLARYQTTLTVYEKSINYKFYIITKNNGIIYYNNGGIFTSIPNEQNDFKLLVDYQQPEWVKNTVFYQIFPERFCNGNPEISVKDGEYNFDGHPTIAVKNWNSVPTPYNESFCLDFFGGDLDGITQKIPYLKKLGVNAIYLNPIFHAATVHKYDCLDFFHVDPHFGGDEALSRLTNALHQNGMKIILDVSINHTGTANKWFNKEGLFFDKSLGAFNNPDSEEREFYFFNDDNSYKAWYDVETLPTLNYTSEKLRNIIYRDSDSLVKKWLKAPYNTDGWRFDVANTMARNNQMQLHHQVWPEIRKSIKETNPQAYILAEDWNDCSEFMKGDEWDSPMNYYGCNRPIRQFYSGGDMFNFRYPELAACKKRMTAKELGDRFRSYFDPLPFAMKQIQFNLLDSHDVPRFHNFKEFGYDQVKGAVTTIFTLPGCANMYYGDEAEIEGRTNDNEGCRYPMPWDKDIESTDSFKMYQKLCNLKTTSPALSDGGFKIVSDNGYTLCWARFSPDELILTIVSNEEKNSKLKIDLSQFGYGWKIENKTKDFLDLPMKTCLKNDFFTLKVAKGKSYLIKFTR